MKRKTIIANSPSNSPASGLVSLGTAEGLGFQAIAGVSQAPQSDYSEEEEDESEDGEESGAEKAPTEEPTEDEQEFASERRAVFSERKHQPDPEEPSPEEIALRQQDAILVARSMEAMNNMPQRPAQLKEEMLTILPTESGKWSQGPIHYHARKNVRLEVPITLARSLISLGKAVLG
jgi:hypothetical protein